MGAHVWALRFVWGLHQDLSSCLYPTIVAAYRYLPRIHTRFQPPTFILPTYHCRPHYRPYCRPYYRPHYRLLSPLLSPLLTLLSLLLTLLSPFYIPRYRPSIYLAITSYTSIVPLS